MAEFQYRVLGPVEVWLDGQPLPIDAPRQRALLAALLLEANRVVSVDLLVDWLWGSSPPAQARNTIQSLVLRLRRILGPEGGLLTRRPGYLLRVEPDRLDLDVFERLAADGRAALDAGDAETAARELRAALALWRGEPLSDAATQDNVEVPRLRERRLRVTEDLVAAELGCGRHADLVAWLTALVAGNPLRERFSGQLMLALHGSGRRAEALEVFQSLRRRLVDELAVEPCDAVRLIHREILAQEGPVETRRPRQLPPDIADFSGRDAVLESMRHLLTGRDALGLAVSGQAGVGKTALTVHIGHLLAGEFPDGQIFVDLHGMDARPLHPSAALAQILRALGVEPASIPGSADERAAMYRGLMAERRVLVLLDNAADEPQVRPLLPGSGPGRVIVTSRRVLASLGAWLPSMPLGLLTHAESVELLTRMLGEKRVCGQEDGADLIAVQCGHLPLALRIAGARLVARPRWPLSKMAGYLADTRRRLDELSTGDLEVRASVRMSVAGLTEPERRAVARLGGLWCPDFAGWLAAAALGVPVAEAEEMAERLVDAQLLEALGFDAAGQARYRFHDLIRDYARELSTGTTRDALDACLTAVHHAAAQVLGVGDPMPGQPPHHSCVHCGEIAGLDGSLAWFAAERPTLTSAVSHALDRSLPEHAWRIAHLSAIFFEVRADWDDWRQTHQAALSAVPQNDRAEAALLCGLSRLFIDKGDAGSAGEHARRAVRLGRAADDPGLEADALASLGFAQWHDSRLGPAGRSFKAGLRLAGKAGCHATEVRCLLGLGHLYRNLGRHDDAILALENAIALIRKGAARNEEPYVLVSLGAVHLACERPEEAAGHFRQAMVLATALSDTRCQVFAMRCLADAHRMAGDAAESVRLMRLVPLIMHRPGEDVGEVQTLRRLGEALTDLGRYEEATEHLRRGLELIRRIAFPLIEAEVLYALGDALARAGDRGGAGVALSQSRDRFAECGMRERSTEAASLLARIGDQGR